MGGGEIGLGVGLSLQWDKLAKNDVAGDSKLGFEGGIGDLWNQVCAWKVDTSLRKMEVERERESRVFQAQSNYGWQ